MRWTLGKRNGAAEARRTNRKRNTVTNVSGRAAELSGRRMHRVVTGLLATALAALTVAVIWMAAQRIGEQLLYANSEYRIKTIDVQSDGRRVSAEKVKQWAELEAGMNLHTVNIAEKRRILLQRVPVIKSVTIKRLMPDRLEVRITERFPIACLGIHHRLGVDQTGYVFAIAPSSDLLPAIWGYSEQISPGARLRGRLLNAVEVVDVLNRTALGGLIRLDGIDVREPDRLVLKLNDGPLVRLSWPDMAMSTPESRLGLEAKLRSLARVLEDARLKNRRLANVDMTFTDEYIPVE